jgi:hypothetical protein
MQPRQHAQASKARRLCLVARLHPPHLLRMASRCYAPVSCAPGRCVQWAGGSGARRSGRGGHVPGQVHRTATAPTNTGGGRGTLNDVCAAAARQAPDPTRQPDPTRPSPRCCRAPLHPLLTPPTARDHPLCEVTSRHPRGQRQQQRPGGATSGAALHLAHCLRAPLRLAITPGGQQPAAGRTTVRAVRVAGWLVCPGGGGSRGGGAAGVAARRRRRPLEQWRRGASARVAPCSVTPAEYVQQALGRMSQRAAVLHSCSRTSLDGKLLLVPRSRLAGGRSTQHGATAA